ncbi:MAG: DNA polymerase, partial [Chloroflexi bacterium]|nr:DNA polymerase [Chloroflexota bacterium]
LEYRELAKLRSTYIDALPGLVNPRTGRIHTTLSQTVAATGRLSSRNPNLQNIPVRDERGRLIRNAFVAGSPDTILLSADYSQIELRVLAHIARDESMLRAFQNDEDIHTATAAQMFEVAPDSVTSSMRRVAKTTNFGIIYGITDFGLAMRTDLSPEESHEIIESYFNKYPAVRKYMDSTIEAAYRDGYVSTLLNRRRQMPELKARVYARRQAGERMAINMPIQGTAAEIMKIAMIEMDRCLREDGFRAIMILQVHDELLFELPSSECERLANAARDVMSSAFDLNVPLKVDVSAGPNWGQMSPV